VKNYSKTSIFIILFAFIFFIIRELLSYNIALKEKIQTTYTNDKAIIKNAFSAQEALLTSIAQLLANDPVVIKSYLENKPELLRKHLSPAWKTLKKSQYIHEIHFFKPTAISFVNFSNFNSIGNDVSKVRTDIAWITSSFKKSSHLFMCKSYAGYRATNPIISNGKMLGALSLGKKVDWLPKIIKQKTQHDSFLVYTQVSTKTLVPKYYKNFMKTKEKFRKYILANKTLNISTKELKDIDFKKDIQNIQIEGKKYILYTFALTDFNKNTMGYISTLTQLQGFKKEFFKSTLQDIFLVVFTTFILLLINRKYNNKINKQLSVIYKLTQDIGNRNFKLLYNTKLLSDTEKRDSLSEIRHNIVDMGHSLEKYYNYLQQKNTDTSKKLIEELYTDKITNLGNLNSLYKNLGESDYTYLALLNIRGFKNINDAFGFEAGNNILKSVASMMQYVLNDGYLFFRVSNDEFAITNERFLEKDVFVEQVLHLIDEIEDVTFKFQNIDINIEVYSGVCLHNDKQLDKASIAIRKAKENRLVHYVYNGHEDTKEIQISNIEMINKIANALKIEGVVPYFQPIVNRDKNIIKYEALVRMLDGDSVLSPFFFLDIAKQTNFYKEITKAVIEQTFKTFENSNKMFSININALDMRNEETVNLIYEELEKCSHPQNVVFEIVESEDIYTKKDIETVLYNIKGKGAKLAIDDFGTGYSNFSYIMKLHPDYLKIDGSLVKDIDTNVLSYNSVKTITNFAHDLQINVVAEFIHSEEVYNICKEIGIDEFQGFYFSEAKPDII